MFEELCEALARQVEAEQRAEEAEEALRVRTEAVKTVTSILAHDAEQWEQRALAAEAYIDSLDDHDCIEDYLSWLWGDPRV